VSTLNLTPERNWYDQQVLGTDTNTELLCFRYKSWQSTIDKIVGCSMHIRLLMGLPEVIMVEPTPDADASKLYSIYHTYHSCRMWTIPLFAITI